jgi:hypothetical protein
MAVSTGFEIAIELSSAPRTMNRITFHSLTSAQFYLPESQCRYANAAFQPVACSPRLPRNKKVNTNPATNPPMCAM